MLYSDIISHNVVDAKAINATITLIFCRFCRIRVMRIGMRITVV